MTSGIILAGGKGSRLGPMAAQISKALVSIGQRPHLAHQVELLRRNGCTDITVVTSADTDGQIRLVSERANLGVKTTVQHSPRGPVDALAYGLAHVDDLDDVIVLMADTFLDVELALPPGDWFGVATTTARRSFCFYDEVRGEYVDGVPPNDETDITVGAYRFTDAKIAYALASQATVFAEGEVDAEVGMATFLTDYRDVFDVEHVDLFETWLDIGDVIALANARRTKFIARQTHDLQLAANGTITKRGRSEGFDRQREWMKCVATSSDSNVASLVPTVHEFGDGWYRMEHIDLPTLSELWLYWPGRPDTWRQILETIVTRLESSLWRVPVRQPDDSVERERSMFVEKARSRLSLVDEDARLLLSPLLDRASEVFKGSQEVRAHGDLNWNNILYSLNTGNCKLVDPRGDATLPISYEFAKLAYSYDGFAHITHNLELDERIDERQAMDELIHKHVEPRKLEIAKACLFIAGAPLHDEPQRQRMLDRGHDLLRGAL